MPAKPWLIAYAKPDQRWAEWVAWQIEALGIQTRIPARDSVPGSNWMSDLNMWIEEYDRIVVIMSRSFNEDPFLLYAKAEAYFRGRVNVVVCDPQWQPENSWFYELPTAQIFGVDVVTAVARLIKLFGPPSKAA